MALTLLETDMKTKGKLDLFTFVFSEPVDETTYTEYVLKFDFTWEHKLWDVEKFIPVVDYPAEASDRLKGAWIGDSAVFTSDNANRLFKKYFKVSM